MRIYGKHREIAENYIEVEYKEYREDGTLKQTGTEDFSIRRFNNYSEWRYIYTWDGKRRNKGGYRWFEEQTAVCISKGDVRILKKVMEQRYPEAEIIQCR